MMIIMERKETIEFKPITRKPGDPIRSEDWNMMQDMLLSDMYSLKREIEELREYVNNLIETIVLTNLESSVGTAYALDEIVQGESDSYNLKTVGLITKQYVTSVWGIGDICQFGIADRFDILYFWSGAYNGNNNMLDVSLEYVEGEKDEMVGTNLYINDKSQLGSPTGNNPYQEYIYNKYGTWYKYKIKNPFPEKEVRYIKFTNINSDTNPRIGNVIRIEKKIKQIVD